MVENHELWTEQSVNSLLQPNTNLDQFLVILLLQIAIDINQSVLSGKYYVTDSERNNYYNH